MNFMHNLLPMQNLQPTGQLEYKVPRCGTGLTRRETHLSFLWGTLRDLAQDLRVHPSREGRYPLHGSLGEREYQSLHTQRIP